MYCCIRWAAFDPQALYLPAVNAANPGKMLAFLQRPEIVAAHADQFAPLKAFGNTFDKPFAGTLFR